MTISKPLMRLLATSLFVASASRSDPVNVLTDGGALVGVETAQGQVFKGVRYAAPPVGSLRWAPPRLATPSAASQTSYAYGPNCPQKLEANGMPNVGGASGPISEDCLFLNIWAPLQSTKAPVMVWLHGGGNTSGAGSLGAYEGGAFTRDGVLLVTINYRLGALGFFAHPALTKAAAPDEPLVNYGLMDQIAALQWVKRNIAAFGGDPDNVTLFGESAGGEDTLLLMTAPAAQGLFSRAIVESGGGMTPLAGLAKREAQDDVLVRGIGAPVGASVEQLRSLPLDKVLELNAARGGPAVDGRLILESPVQAFSYGHYAHVPLIIGSNSYEASLLKSLKVPASMALAMAPADVKAAYADIPDDQSKAEAIFTDGAMGAPAQFIAGKASKNPSYLYVFPYVAEAQRGTTPGAGHASEIPFVFDSWNTLGAVGGGIKPSPADLEMTARLHGCWISFAKTGKPTCPSTPAWPAYSSASDTLMRFSQPPHLEIGFNKQRYKVQQASQLTSAGLLH